jgi:RND family efflux transporter MFP subunit
MSLDPIRSAAGAAMFLVPLVLAGCEHAPEATSSKPPVVRVVPVIEKKITDYALFTGRTAAVNSVDVRARVNGYLDSIDFTAGQDVKKDQRLFKIDPRPYQADLNKAQGAVSLADAKTKLATAEFNRSKAIARGTPGAVTQEELEKNLAAQTEAQAALSASRAAAESADLNLKFTDVLSPIDGVVGRNLITVGNLVTQDNTHLTTIVSLDPIYAYFDVDENSLLRFREAIREGKIVAKKPGEFSVELGLADEGDRYPHKGVCDFVNTQLDASTGTIQLRGVFANSKPEGSAPRVLTPGMFVRIRVPVGEPHPALLVPEASIGRDQNRKYVLIVDKDSKVQRRYVELGAEQPGGLQVVEPAKDTGEGNGGQPEEQAAPPLAAGDQVIVTGLQRIQPGLTVEAKPLEAKTASTPAK